ncbi:MAG: PadR family transcriptional regulator [Treponema sp.]|nr:PadR family transcriptional regulator [Treponema sp.]
MTFTAGSAVLDAVVLSIVARDSEGTYGYRITQDVRSVMDVSESSLYPVLRRLQAAGLLETYDKEFSGRNRRYYRITVQGVAALDAYRRDWQDYRNKMDGILLGITANN